jgi:hypothetical protein
MKLPLSRRCRTAAVDSRLPFTTTVANGRDGSRLQRFRGGAVNVGLWHNPEGRACRQYWPLSAPNRPRFRLVIHVLYEVMPELARSVCHGPSSTSRRSTRPTTGSTDLTFVASLFREGTDGPAEAGGKAYLSRHPCSWIWRFPCSWRATTGAWLPAPPVPLNLNNHPDILRVPQPERRCLRPWRFG